MKIGYSNISGGLVFAGQTYGEMLFSKVSVEQYIEYFKTQDFDILSLSEVHLEGKNESTMVAYMARELGFEHHSSLALSKSHLDTSKQLGMAVLSKFPITNEQEFLIPSPKLEVDRPNGDHWIMFDKGGQRVTVDVDGEPLAIVNFSYFPFHHFGRRVDESDFARLRQNLVNVLLDPTSGAPTIITGDTNNKGIPTKQAFPELFANDTLRQAVAADTTVVGAQEQIDQILYPPEHFTATNQFVDWIGSDHAAIGSTVNFR